VKGLKILIMELNRSTYKKAVTMTGQGTKAFWRREITVRVLAERGSNRPWK